MRRLIIFAIFILISGHAIYAAESDNEARAFCQGYLDAVIAQDWTRAREFWHPEEIEKASRLGISYKDIPAKYDCASPLITNIEKVVSGLIEVSLENVRMTDNGAEFKVRLLYQGDTIRTKYYAQKIDGKWYFVSPLHVFAKHWKKYTTRYANVYCNNDSLVNDYALDALDEFIAKTGKLLNIDSDKMALLEKEKLDYYLCSERDFEKLTGYNAHGITSLPYDAVITRHLPHYHEMTHFMINYALQDLPLYTLPVMQEGLAVAMGGRWGKSTLVVDELGAILLKNQICSLNELLTFDNFNIDLGMPDISYPVSGLFVKYLLDKLSINNFKNLYLELSGSLDDLRSWDREHIISIFEKALQSDWDSIQSDFSRFCEKYESWSISAGSATLENDILITLNNGVCHASIYETADDYLIEIDSLPEGRWGAILLTDSSAGVSPLYQSRLFHEHFGIRAYAGQKYALRFNSEEAGLYNYYYDILEAKYINSFFPKSHYRDPANNRIGIRFKRELLPKPLESYELHLTM